MRRPRSQRPIWLSVCAVALLAAACSGEDVDPGEAWISPLDGQTGWSADSPLTVIAEDLDIPPDYPLPQLIRVSRVNGSGGFVAGNAELLDGSLRFTPDEPWAPDTRFAWVVDVPLGLPHGPSLDFPEALQQGAIFDTSSALDVLAGTLQTVPDRDPELCLVLSRKTEAADDVPWTLQVNGESIEAIGSLADPAVWAADLTFPEGDSGVDVLCFQGLQGTDPDDPSLVSVGDRVRLFLGDGQWTIDDIGTEGITAAVEALRQTGGGEP